MQKHYIVDTNILIENPDALSILRNGEENFIYIPNHVLFELDKLKSDEKIGSAAQIAVKKIEDNKDWLIFINNEKSHSPYTDNVDNHILSEIKNDSFLIKNGTLVTSDRLLRINAENQNIKTDDFLNSLPFLTSSEQHTGFYKIDEEPIINSFVWKDGKPFFTNSKHELKIIDYEHSVWNIKPKNIYQNLAFELLLNNDLDIVTVQSKAGLGKTFLVLAAALKLVFENKTHKKIIITKSSEELGKSSGFLPGNLNEKFFPVIRPILDLIYKLQEIRSINKLFINPDDVNEGFNEKRFEILPLNYIQGMNIEDSILIIDEAQNLSRKIMRNITTRCGENTRLFAVGDTRQVISNQNEYNNGLNWLVKLCKGEPNYGHIVLKGKQSRGPVTDLILKVGL